MIRRRVIVHGLVQGVFFRDTVRRRAQSWGVAGWIRNRSDGAVEAHFEGLEPAVERMVAWCRQGPARATVTRVDVREDSPAGLESFRIQ